MELIHPSQLQLTGDFDERLRRSAHHIIALNTAEMRREFTNPERRWHWGADYMGRWIAVMSLISQYTGEDYAVDQVADELIGFQRPDGSFGSYSKPHDFQEWFGMGRGLVGLLEYYAVSESPAALDAAVRLGDFFISHLPNPLDSFAECYSSALEGLVLLYQITGEQRFLRFSHRVAESSPIFLRIWSSTELDSRGWRKPVAGQTHSHLTTARGLVDLYQLTRERKYLDAVKSFHDFITQDLLWVSGGIPEFVFLPDANETCSDADWLRLNLQLWQLTGEQKYLEFAECVLVNQLFFDQDNEGGFCCWRNLNGLMGATMDMCCAMHGPRALWECMRYLYTLEPGVLQANLFLDGKAQLKLDGQPVLIASRNHYSSGEFVASFEFSHPATHVFSFRARVPEWAGSGWLSVNGQHIQGQNMPGYLETRRPWLPGDRVEVHLPMEVRVIEGNRIGQHVINPAQAAIFLGPRLFCFTDQDNPQTLPPLVRIHPGRGFKVHSPDRLEAQGVNMKGDQIPLVLTPLSDIGGSPIGIGRMHPVRTKYYKVWMPL